ncbi:MAG: hexokinase [Negativicutes bacterium]|nr:hexokinase [Negativicutes bacterium]
MPLLPADIYGSFALDAAGLRLIAADFKQAMVQGLSGEGGSLKMLPSFLEPPAVTDRGRYVALDFGGSNLRVMLIELQDGRPEIVRRIDRKLPPAPNGIALFRFIAAMIGEIAAGGRYLLGHTFSFPCRQYSRNQAELIRWTKEIAIPGVEGEDINRLLYAALKEAGVDVIPVAILNDTVGTLLTAAYTHPQADIASICGTGHNTCYLEPRLTLSGKPMIINMESGNFDLLPFSPYDNLLDAASENPGQQRLEKMAAGRYLGEIARLMLTDLAERGLVALGGNIFSRPYSLSTVDLAGWLADGQDIIYRAVAELVTARSARLVAATFVGVLAHIDPALEQEHIIAVDGALFDKMPGYRRKVEIALQELLAAKAGQVMLKLVRDGSGLGAAIAAAQTERSGKHGIGTDAPR